MARLLFRVVKGFLYGIVLGLFMGIGVYLLAAAVAGGLGVPIPSPEALFGIVFAASVLAGVAAEYSSWLEEKGAKQ